MIKDDSYYLKQAYLQAKKAEKLDEVPVGAIIVLNDTIIAKAHNLKMKKQNPLAHAEILAIQKALKKTQQMYLNEAVMYVTLEPCSMCAGALIQSRIKKVVFGALDKKGGAIYSSYQMYSISGMNHYPEIVYLDSLPECSKILTNYFKNKRKI